MVSDEKIQEIRERADIVEIISSYVSLKRTGANYQGLCPFHAEKTPSFNVNPARQTFHCFGCEVGGDVFAFLMRLEGYSFPEAVVEVGKKVGIEVEQRRMSPTEEKRQQERERLYRINEVAADFFHETLMTRGAGALSYLERRGYSAEVARKYRLGLASSDWSDLVRHLEKKGFAAENCRKLGLIRAGKSGNGDYDFFRNRLMFPVMNTSGKVVAFGGRVFDDSLPKYMNSPESEIYRKASTLYGLSQARSAARRTGECILVEGYFDLLAVSEAGAEHVVATCGTALTSEHAGLLRRYARKVLLLFDQDSAGRKAAFRGMEVLLKEGLSVAMVNLEAGEDPDSYVRKHGTEAFRARLAEARPALAVFMDDILRGCGEDVESRARAVELILTRVKLLDSSVERRLYLQELAEKTGLDMNFLQSGGKAGGSVRPVPAPKSAALRPRPQSGERPELKSQNWLLILLATDTETRNKVAAEGTEKVFWDEARRCLADRLLGLEKEVQSPEEVLSALELTENEGRIVNEIFRQDVRALIEDKDQVFADCCASVDRQRLKKKAQELTRLICEAAKAGDKTLLKAYSAEQLELNRRLRKMS